MTALLAKNKLTEDQYLHHDLSISAVNVLDKRPNGKGLHTYSGMLTVELEDLEDAKFNVEWVAYHKDSAQIFLKNDPQWFTLYGDWHINFVNKNAEIKIEGFSLVDEDGEKLSDHEEKHFVLSVFHENYHWKNVVESAIKNSTI